MTTNLKEMMDAANAAVPRITTGAALGIVLCGRRTASKEEAEQSNRQ